MPSPLNRCLPMLKQICVCTAEMFIPKKSIISRKRRRMYGSKYQMLTPIYKSSFFLRITSPQNKNNRLREFQADPTDIQHNGLPSPSRMACRKSFFNRQRLFYRWNLVICPNPHSRRSLSLPPNLFSFRSHFTLPNLLTNRKWIFDRK